MVLIISAIMRQKRRFVADTALTPPGLLILSKNASLRALARAASCPVAPLDRCRKSRVISRALATSAAVMLLASAPAVLPASGPAATNIPFSSSTPNMASAAALLLVTLLGAGRGGSAGAGALGRQSCWSPAKPMRIGVQPGVAERAGVQPGAPTSPSGAL